MGAVRKRYFILRHAQKYQNYETECV